MTHEKKKKTPNVADLQPTYCDIKEIIWGSEPNQRDKRLETTYGTVIEPMQYRWTRKNIGTSLISRLQCLLTWSGPQVDDMFREKTMGIIPTYSP